VKSFWSIVLSLCLVQGRTIATQSPQQQVQEQSGNLETPVIKVTTRLVQVNVVVHNKKGEPVRDLTKEDFVLFDKGQEQKILFFSKESSEALPTNLPPLAPGVVSNRYTNFRSREGEKHLAPIPTSLSVILLDGLNTAFTDQHYAKESLIKFLNQLQPGDRVAIYTLTNGLRVLHDFTSDTESLLAALKKHRNQDSSALSASSYDDANTGNDDLDAFLDRSNEAIATFYQARRAQTTLEALQTIAHHLAGMPGRKNLIWLSGSFPTLVGLGPDGALGRDFQDFSSEMQRAMRTMNDSSIAIYPVDARGLMGVFATMPSISPQSRGGNPARGRPPGDQRAQNQLLQTHGTMREIADRTGGRAFMNTNDLTGAIHEAMDDARVTYVLAYSPSHDQWDNKFREIKIKLNRSGLDARYRKGYYAYSEHPTDLTLRKAILSEAASSPLASTGLAIFAGVAQLPTPQNSRTAIRMVMDAHEVAFGQNAEGKREATLDLLLVAFDDKGKPLYQLVRTLRPNMDEGAYGTVLKNGMVINVDSEAPEKSARVRLIVHDVLSGLVGSVDLPFK
jgi:VWFA-related protein